MEHATTDHVTMGHSPDYVYARYLEAKRRWGTGRITTRSMNGSVITYPSSWDDEPERRTLSPTQERRSAERDRRIAEMRRELGSPGQAGNP